MLLTKRSELLFLYDSNYWNPNGDPLDGNKPRIDEETGKNIVTDVRLKRTIRDFLLAQGEGIFVQEIADEEGKIQDAKLRAEDFLLKDNKKLKSKDVSLKEMKSIILQNILRDCIDVRLFGSTIPIEKSPKEKSSITLTGPVQFKMGQSLHRVKLQYIKGTGAFASGKDKEQKTFREEYLLPYSLICFYGIINENAAQVTNLTEEDVTKLLKAMWVGTLNLISRSKAGQQPRLLLRVIYKEKNYHVGELDKLISFKVDKNEEEIRDISEGILDMTNLLNVLESNRDKIEKIQLKTDQRVILHTDIMEAIRQKGLSVEQIIF